MSVKKFVYTANSLKISQIAQAIISCTQARKYGDKLFKDEFARFLKVDSSQIFLFASARMGLYTILKSLNMSNGDEVILPGYTCTVVPNAVKYSGAKAVYVDIEELTLNINFNKLKDVISINTKAIVIPHNFGIATEYIKELRKAYPQIILIEDCAHTLGTIIDNQLIGTLGDASFFSHEYSKVITTGMGGTLIINNKNLIIEVEKNYKTLSTYPIFELIKIFITLFAHTITSYKYTARFKRYIIFLIKKLHLLFTSSKEELKGILPKNYPIKLNSCLAYIGYLQLRNRQYIIQHNKDLARAYNDIFSIYQDIQTFYNPKFVYVRYPIVLNAVNQNKIVKELDEILEIQIGVWFDDVVHPKGSFRYCYEEGTCPVGEKVSRTIINLPMSIHISVSDILKNQEFIQKIFLKYGVK